MDDTTSYIQKEHCTLADDIWSYGCKLDVSIRPSAGTPYCSHRVLLDDVARVRFGLKRIHIQV